MFKIAQMSPPSRDSRLSTRRAGSSLKGSGRKLKLMAGTTVMRMLGALMAYSWICAKNYSDVCPGGETKSCWHIAAKRHPNQIVMGDVRRFRGLELPLGLEEVLSFSDTSSASRSLIGTSASRSNVTPLFIGTMRMFRPPQDNVEQQKSLFQMCIGSQRL